MNVKKSYAILKHPKFDCFAYRDGTCTKTMIEDCSLPKPCPFYKTQEQFDAGIRGGKSK